MRNLDVNLQKKRSRHYSNGVQHQNPKKQKEHTETLKAPDNGMLSGMIITKLFALVVFVLAILGPTFQAPFMVEASESFLNHFLLSVIIMAIHKYESYYFKEYDRCPVYLTSGRRKYAKNSRKAMFGAFVGIFLGMAFAVAFVLRGAPWVLLVPMIWLGQGLHEHHHLAKTFAEKRYYPGAVTSVLYVMHINLFMFPAWYQSLAISNELWFQLYYGVQPFIFLAFYLEHIKYQKEYLAYQQQQKDLEHV